MSVWRTKYTEKVTVNGVTSRLIMSKTGSVTTLKWQVWTNAIESGTPYYFVFYPSPSGSRTRGWLIHDLTAMHWYTTDSEELSPPLDNEISVRGPAVLTVYQFTNMFPVWRGVFRFVQFGEYIPVSKNGCMVLPTVEAVETAMYRE